MATQFASFYAALISAWGAMGSQPSGTSPASTPILAGNTAAQNLAILNAWTVVGTATYGLVNGNKVLNAIAQADWNAITDAQRSQVGTVTGAFGGVDPTPGQFAATVLGGIFTGKTTTLNALGALQNSAKIGATIPWWQSVGLPWPPTLNDLIAAGLVANSTMWTYVVNNKRVDDPMLPANPSSVTIKQGNFNIFLDLTYQQVDSLGNPTATPKVVETIRAADLSDAKVTATAVARIVNVLLLRDAAFAALTSA